MGKPEDLIRELAEELEHRDYTVKFDESPRSFTINAQLALELDDRLKDLEEGAVVLLDEHHQRGHGAFTRKLYLGKLSRYEKGRVGDNWLGRDKTIVAEMGGGVKTTISTGEERGRMHHLISDRLLNIGTIARKTENFNQESVQLNIQDDMIYTKPEEIEAILLLANPELLTHYRNTTNS